MKFKRLIQTLTVFVLVCSTFGGSQSVLASTYSSVPSEAMVIDRNLNFWDATYVGFVNGSIHEKWHFEFTETHTFVIAVSTISGDLVPLLTLQDSNGNEISHGVSTLTSTQPAGNYSIQIQPDSGGGFYVLTLREVVQTNPTVVTTVNLSTVNVGETAVATVSLNNVPAEGYTSAEFTCSYSATLVDVGDPIVTNLFGSDAAVAVNNPQNGTFIVAIAGSNGNKATTSGEVFGFSVTGLLAGQTTIECTARVSKGDNLLTGIDHVGATLNVTGTGPTATFTPTPIVSPTATSSTPVDTTATATSSTPVDTTATATSSTPVDTTATATSSTPVETATPTSSSTPVVTATNTLPAETATPTFTSTPVASPTFTSTPLPNGNLNGQVIASKAVTVGLYDGTNALVTSVVANNDGTFSLSAPAGTYTLRATASGFLTAEGSVTLTSGGTATQPTVALLAGDIDGNGVIDQFDAMTIGMSYNTATPASADLNNDNVINVLDLELLAQNYRETGPTAWQ